MLCTALPEGLLSLMTVIGFEHILSLTQFLLCKMGLVSMMCRSLMFLKYFQIIFGYFRNANAIMAHILMSLYNLYKWVTFFLSTSLLFP